MGRKERALRVMSAVLLAVVLLVLAGAWVRWESRRMYGYDEVYEETFVVEEMSGVL